MPKKKTGKKGKGKKGKKGKGKKSKVPEGPPNFNGKRPGGMELRIMTTDGKVFEVAELGIAKVSNLKDRIIEVCPMDRDQMHIFCPSSSGRPLSHLQGYRSDWAWPKDILLAEMDDILLLSTYADVKAGSTLYLMLKLNILSRTNSFTGGAPSTPLRPGTGARRRSSLANTILPPVDDNIEGDTIAIAAVSLDPVEEAPAE